MDFTFAKINELSPNVVAAMVGAVVTLLAALINLRIAWRREVVSRLEGTKGGKGRKRLLPAIVFMVAASTVGGYALALYLMQSRESESALLRTELRQRADQIQSSAERIENARSLERYTALADARLAEERRRGAEGVAAALRLAPCRPGADAACREDEAPRTSVCAVLPARAAALELAVAAAFVGSEAPSVPVPTPLGADLGTARVAAKPVERSVPDGKLLCLEVWSWDAHRALDLRIVVKYLLGDAPPVAEAADQSKASGS